ncbi:DNA-binding LytR/AlgR family response regulator [Spirosoma lacussanchae]|uniref:LytR/AlgR family response regulator transcription factor n=1 Tax=Spirosoma lacussanchae TaxID=1884249 RepID=UPI00110927A1|nr:LytTR family DNA-binding domain-containing protein [Spirosoma lacussanchae]
MSLTCIIVDDELMARNALQRMCEQHEALSVVGTFASAAPALNYLAEHSVDLIWLDVEMPDLSGFGLLEQLSSIPLVVLTTSKTEYAYDAYQYQVTDYLKKPITLPRFKIAVERALELGARNRPTVSQDRQEIYIKTDGRYIRLPFDTIAYIENMGDYVKIFTTTQTYIVYATMKYIEEKLGPQFLRVHRSYIVHLGKIVDIEENTLVIQNKVIPISRANKSELMNRLNLL